MAEQAEVERFRALLGRFTSKWTGRCPRFAFYFIEYYTKVYPTEMWALCYKISDLQETDFWVNTNNALERWHRTIKRDQPDEGGLSLFNLASVRVLLNRGKDEKVSKAKQSKTNQKKKKKLLLREQSFRASEKRKRKGKDSKRNSKKVEGMDKLAGILSTLHGKAEKRSKNSGLDGGIQFLKNQDRSCRFDSFLLVLSSSFSRLSVMKEDTRVCLLFCFFYFFFF